MGDFMKKNDNSKYILVIVNLLNLLCFLVRIGISFLTNYEMINSKEEDIRLTGILLFINETVSIAIPALIILVLCEILKNAYKSKHILSEISEINEYNALKDSFKFTPYWVCSCGTVNGINDSYCKKCNNYQNHTSKATDYPTFATWLCPECDETNPNSSRICKNCGYQK